MPVAVGEQHRAVRDDGVEHGPGGDTVGEGVHRPAATADPLGLRVLGRVGGDGRQVAVDTALFGQVAAEQLHSGDDGMHVGVLEAGRQQPAVEVDHLGHRPGQLFVQLALVADREDASAADGDGGR